MSSKASTGRIETHDVDQQNQAAYPWDVIHRQLSPGNFLASTDYVRLDDILLYRQRYTRRTLVTGASPAGFMMLGGRSTPKTDLVWCSEHLEKSCMAFAQSASDVEFVIPDNSDHWVVLIPEKRLSQHLDQEFLAGEPFWGIHHMSCEPGIAYGFVNLLFGLIEKYTAHSELLTEELVCKAIESELLDRTARLLSSGAMATRRISPQKSSSIFKKAIDFVESSPPNLRMTIPEFAQAVGVSQRTLEIVFKQKLGITPKRFLRLFQFNQARQALLNDAGKAPLSVTEVAFHSGFTEMGRFAVEYRRLFGEAPSATLKRKTTIRPKSLADIILDPTPLIPGRTARA